MSERDLGRDVISNSLLLYRTEKKARKAIERSQVSTPPADQSQAGQKESEGQTRSLSSGKPPSIYDERSEGELVQHSKRRRRLFTESLV